MSLRDEKAENPIWFLSPNRESELNHSLGLGPKMCFTFFLPKNIVKKVKTQSYFNKRTLLNVTLSSLTCARGGGKLFILQISYVYQCFVQRKLNNL